jgi:predicted RNA-binding protein with PIN domain
MQIRYLVDVMNVIGSRPDKWWNDPDRAMRGMSAALDEYSGLTGRRIVAVFDREPPGLAEPEHIEVVVAKWKGRNAADHEIAEIVRSDTSPQGIRVVTSDKRLAETVEALGAGVIPAGAFRNRMERSLA